MINPFEKGLVFALIMAVSLPATLSVWEIESAVAASSRSAKRTGRKGKDARRRLRRVTPQGVGNSNSRMGEGANPSPSPSPASVGSSLGPPSGGSPSAQERLRNSVNSPPGSPTSPSGTTTNVYDDQGSGGSVGQAGGTPGSTRNSEQDNRNGGGAGPPDNSVTPSLYMPICFIIPPDMPADAVNTIVRANADSYGQCDIAMQPFVFRVNNVPDDEAAINRMAPQSCPLNSELGVGGSAVQVFAPYATTADAMCGSRRQPGPGFTEEVAGCSVVGNGNSGGTVRSAALNQRPGGYGQGGNAGGSPAVSIVDSTANYSAGVSCHELGHSNGGPGRGGDFLVNVGDGRGPSPAAGGMGLEAQDVQGTPEQNRGGGGAEGAGLGGQCNFTSFGCASLRGGSNPNTKKYKWNRERQMYFSDKGPESAKFRLGENFFQRREPPPSNSGSPNIAGVPRNSAGEGSARQDVNESAESPHKKPTPKLAGPVLDPKSQAIVDKYKDAPPASGGDIEILPPGSRLSAGSEIPPPVQLQPPKSTSLFYDDGAQYKNSSSSDGGGGGTVSGGGGGSGVSTAVSGGASGGSIGANGAPRGPASFSSPTDLNPAAEVSGGFGRTEEGDTTESPGKRSRSKSSKKKSARPIRTIQQSYESNSVE